MSSIKTNKKRGKSQPKKIAESDYISLMKNLRKVISKKYKLYPIYTVYNNEVMEKLIQDKPTTIEELLKIKGFGEKKAQLFGNDIIKFIKKELVDNGVTSNKEEELLFKFLINERSKIAKYNNLSESEVYDNQTAKNIVKMKPRSIKKLKKVFGFNEDNIQIFGDYLIRKITIFLDGSKAM